MSYFDYQASRGLTDAGHPFYALIMTAMRQADTTNQARLKAAWPQVWDELAARYTAPGGVLPSDPLRVREQLAAAAMASGMSAESARQLASLPPEGQ